MKRSGNPLSSRAPHAHRLPCRPSRWQEPRSPKQSREGNFGVRIVDVGDHFVRTDPCRRQLLPECGLRSVRLARHAKHCFALLATLLCLVGSTSAPATEGSAERMQSLDEQVQEIKSDVLGIAAELSGLEERLLYPSNTQVAVFVSLAEGESARLDSVRIHLDGEPVAHHIYSFKELEALQKGGVQRIFTGNVATGQHSIEVTVAGKLASGREFEGSESFSFEKEVEPKLVGLTLATRPSGAASIQLGGW